MNIFRDMKIYGYFCLEVGGSPRNWTIFRCNFYAFKGLFFTSRIFGGLLKFQIFLRSLKFLIFLGGEW